MTTIILTQDERSHLLLALSFVESELPEHYSLLRKLDEGGLMEALVEAASAALDAIGDVLDDAYHNAEQVCCGLAGSECCGATEPVLSESDQAIMDKFAPIYRALENALAAYRNGCEA